MSSGIDKQFVRDYYQKMTDHEVLRILAQGLTGLTPEAQEVVKEEIQRRKLDVDVSKVLRPEEEDLPGKVYDPNGCPVDEPNRIWLERSFLKLLALFGEENTQSRQVLIPERIHFP